MNFQLVPADSADYRDALASLPHDVYHFPEYQALCARQEGAEPWVALVEEGRERLIVPLLVRPTPGGAYRDATSAYGYPGPLLSTRAALDLHRGMFATLRDELAARSIISVFIRTHPILDATLPELAGLAHVQTHGETVYIDCAESTEEQWRGMESGHKNHINRARRLGHVAQVDQDWQHFDDFFRIYAQNMQRVSATDFYFFPRDYFLELRAALGAHLELAIVQIDGAVAAAGLFTEVGDIVQYHLSGTDESFLKLTPMKTLLNFMRERCVERKNRWFHLGGGLGGQADSLFAFKAGFSRHRRPFRTLRIVTDTARYAALTEQHAPQARPDDLSGFFPAYRK